MIAPNNQLGQAERAVEALTYGSMAAYSNARVAVEGLRACDADITRERLAEALEAIGRSDLGEVLR